MNSKRENMAKKTLMDASTMLYFSSIRIIQRYVFNDMLAI
jgi:hypothetical protein